MALREHLAGFLSDFGTEGQLAGFSVRGIFDKEYRDVLGIVEGAQPVYTCQSADINGLSIGATAVIEGATYSVARIEHDGTGMARVYMK